MPFANDVNSNLSTTMAMSSPVSSNRMPVSSVMPSMGLSTLQSSTIVPTLEGVDLAGRVLEWQMKNDNLFPQLADQLHIGQEAHGVSGLSDIDYPMLESGPSGLPLLRQMGVVNRVPLPPELLEHFAHMQSYCMMGLFPAIQRAWLSIDSDIYVWTYDDGGDLSYFDGLSESIIAVELVKPRAGIFQPHIQYLLCLATTVEIVLLGVSFSGSNTNYEEMHLLPEPLFAVPTDGAYIVTISGTSDGRIFMGAKDGCVYEFVYQAEEGFFGRKCRKVNHSKSSFSFLIPSFINAAFAEEDPLVQLSIDETRHILYARSEKGTLQVYDLGLDGKAMNRVAALNCGSIVQSAANIARTVDRTSFRPLVSISALQSNESTCLHLVAVTSSGVRLYFTTLYLRSLTEAVPSARPTTLQLVQVRLPPGYAANASPQRPHQVHSALYSRGTLFLAAGGNGSPVSPSVGAAGTHSLDNDVVWTLSNALFPATAQLSETQNTVVLDGRTWALAEVTPSAKAKPTAAGAPPPAPEPPLVVTQHASPPRRFVFLTTQCCHIMTQLRPVDILRQLLVDASGPDSNAVRAFFQVLREDQACATALILACSTSVQDTQVADWASRAIFLYGGEVRTTVAPGLAVSSPMGVSPFLMSPGGAGMQNTPGNIHAGYTTLTSPSMAGGFNPNAISTPQLSAYSSFTSTTAPAGEAADYQFSGRHNGLYLYFGRLLRPLWLLPLAHEVGVGKSQLLDSVATSDEVIAVLGQLNALKGFVHANVHQGGGSVNGGAPEKGRLQEAQMQERKSLLALKQLLDHAAEVLALWKVICDHQLHLLAQAFSNELKMTLKSMLFRDLILASGSDTCIALINALIHRYLDDSASTDAISEKLRQVCPSLYRNEDALCTKINEQLNKACNLMASTGAGQQQEREQLLRQTLEACKQIPQRLDLGNVCQQLAACQFYSGVVELCCMAAEKHDPHRRALLYYHNGDDQQPGCVEALMARKACYRQICQVLQQLYTAAACHPQSPSVPKSPGPVIQQQAASTFSSVVQLSPFEAQRLADETLLLALQSGDEVCHVCLFDWLMDNKWDDKLLEIQSPYLENYLKRQTSSEQNQQPDALVTKYDLLWKYYERSGNFIAAARVLSRLADAHSTVISLPLRIEYLSRSIVCARAAETSFGNAIQGQFLYELEEKMDVAKVQSQVLEAVSRLPNSPTKSDAISRLNSDLLDVTQLYEQFAEPLALWECKLAILHCAGHYDAALVANVWSNVINSEMKKLERADDETKLSTVSSKMRALSRTYAASEQFFPLDFIVKTLEAYSIRLNGPPNFVTSILLDSGVSFQRLFSTYNKLYAAKDPVWQAEGKPYHLLQVLASLLNQLVDSPGTLIPTAERRTFAGQCVDAVEIYLTTDLHCSAPTATKSGLVAEFRNLQARLERL